ncbi:hypothetical protein RE628_02070 [Paenibacillus sp. D2_2]|uniref:hypothetical protein n=1 Tax=Paenibacillus sp. D2_2 TaxID=3073092 RepID=UPI0028167C0F|nr:hypothetical protein [Paenibacillus sp. D2_2]WMT41380.1 hypothetical protein RE628_02070 [Paenibacillus sp. D2_2]
MTKEYHRNIIYGIKWISLFIGCCLLLTLSALLASCSEHNKNALQQTGELFLNHKNEFLDTLTEMTDTKQRSSIISKIAYNLSYKDPKEIKQELTKWQTRTKRSSKENEVIAELIQAVENPY